jgi:RNA polymerase sigma factor (sigma-70 family)
VVLDCFVTSIEEAPAANNRDSGGSFRARDENALLTAVKRGQTSAFDELWQSHAGRLLRTTYRITRNREDAEDALQGALLNAFVHIRTFDGRSSFSTWLQRIAINSALMILRRNRSSPQVSLDDARDGRGQAEFEALHSPSPDPEASYTDRERKAILAKAIEELPPPMRGALVLQKLEERSTKEVAQIMGVSVSAAKARVFRAKFMLQKSLNRNAWPACAAR